MRRTLDDPQSPGPRDTQYFELWGSREIWNNGWEAIAIHKPVTSFDSDRWELYNMQEDFSQSENVAAKYADRLEQMKKLWWSEAAKNGALPQLEATGGRQRTSTRLSINDTISAVCIDDRERTLR